MNGDFDKLDQELFEKIHFAERFAEISELYPSVSDDYFMEIRNIDFVKKIMESFGYKVRYFKRENFFQVSEKKGDYEFFFNIALEYGRAELIWSILHNKKYLEGITGLDVWTGIYRTLKKCRREDAPSYPHYQDYNEVEDILKECFALWEDFKREFLEKYH